MSDKQLESIDPGNLLPGYSLPVATVEGHGVHAFREFLPLRLDGLGKTSRAWVLRSFCDVACSLKQLHQAGQIDGRIASARFHDRGTASHPKATLWVDANSMSSETVHAGDAEAMYWRPQRLQSGADPLELDDWYALGIVLAEALLSSESVRKIWELSKQDGEFAESLVKNLKRAKGERWFRRAAVQLVQGSANGTMPASTIARLASPYKAYNPTPIYISIAASLIATSVILWSVVSRRRELQGLETQLLDAREAMTALEKRADEFAALRDSSKVKVAVPSQSGSELPPQNQRAPEAIAISNAVSDQQRWQDEMAGRSLEDVVADSASISPQSWVKNLVAIHAVIGQKQWRGQDAKLRRDVQRAVDAPWDQARLDAVNERLASLGEAYVQWQKWARSSMSISAIQTRRGLMPAGMVKDYLGQWLGETLDIDELQVRVQVEEAPKDNESTAHRLGMEADSGEASDEWQWGSAAGVGESISLALEEYRSGDSVSFWLQQDSSIPYWDTTVIEHTFESPLLVWLLGKGLRLTDSESGYSLLLSTTKRIGPPVKLEGATVTLKPVQVRKTVDPLDELPFGLE